MKKGFTLIELLAVIVILAIIALIVTPIILNIISSTKVSANERSAELYITAVEQAIARKNFDGEFNPTQCTIENSIVTCDGEELNVEVNGEKPTTGTIILEDGSVISGTTLNFNAFTATLNSNNKIEIGEAVGDGDSSEDDGTSGGTTEGGGTPGDSTTPTIKAFTLTSDADSSGTISMGDVITYTFGDVTENFYVVENDGTNIEMLTEYNLSLTSPYLQDQTGATNSISFSSTNYWSSSVTTYPAYIYDSNSNIYPIVEGYVSYLNSNGVSGATGKLMSYEQTINLGCTVSPEKTCKTAPSWVYSTSYRLGYAYSAIHVWFVNSAGLYGYNGYGNNYTGVRPVITVPKANISN